MPIDATRIAAGMRPAIMMLRYGTPRYDAMTNAEAPMTGGRTWPDVEATASIPAARWPAMPLSCIVGMVNEPVMAALAVYEPLIDPMTAEDRTAVCATPDLMYFAETMAIRRIRSKAPYANSRPAYRRKGAIHDAVSWVSWP
jgi:hypothetical protein